ncbi:NUDIX hydrolase [Paracoccus sp. PARArs4]|uniref:NUDIX hydrolase n=1 Tax=Paracoccus sp. PARArs4 TaxID=2853442 RepID=UPI0024A7326E|nr:NUDIX hydrolase [Paracoccus sp. PARArs4]
MARSPQSDAFNGAKLLLRRESSMLTLLRDDFPGLPFPGHWDLPGGGREGGESPLRCALRELSEEVGLSLSPDRLTGHAFPSQSRPGMTSWLFTGQITASEIASLRLGDEGQAWAMMPVADYLAHPLSIPHFRDWIRAVLPPAPCCAPAGAGCRP